MKIFMARWEPQVYALMRIVVGLLFLCHGADKLFGAFGQMPREMMNGLTYTAGAIEFIGGIMIMIGFITGWAAFICSGQMACAYWMAHGTKGLFPIQNGGEPAVIYCFVFLFISAYGSGIWSVDAMMRRR